MPAAASHPEVLYAPTTDGWKLAVHHWPPRGQRPKRHPILMVHGLGANRLNIDLDEGHSVARAARDRGFAVYVLELRGAGLSRPPGGRDRALFQWGFGDHAHYDLPAAVTLVLGHSGAPAFHGLGHSMGGMLLYAYGTGRPPALRSISTVGSPLVSGLQLGTNELRLLQLAVRLAPVNALRRVPIKRLMGVAGSFITLSARLVDGLLLNAANTEPEVMARMAKEAIADFPVRLAVEIMEQMTAGAAIERGPYAHEARLGEIDVPVQAVSGSVDRVAPVPSVEAAVARLDGPDVRYRRFGVADGARADYGHADLLVGRRAPDEVFPHLLDFVEEVD